MKRGFSAEFNRALVVAALVHEGTPRKGTVIPYIIHPVHVATVLLRHGYDGPVVVAALLHDVLEDIDYHSSRVQTSLRETFPTAGFPAEITDGDTFRGAFRRFFETEFGPEVVRLVDAVSEAKNDGGPRRSWLERRQELLERIAAADADVIALKAADSLHNARSILEDLRHHGATVMGRFKASPGDTLWYYAEVSKLVSRRLGGTPIARELASAVRALEDALR